jgi:flagellar biosynthesis/type III secretory pathway protein FliH
MISSEWNWDTALKVARKEGREDGLEEGMKKGMKKGMNKGMNKGIEKSRQHFLEMINQGLSIEEIKQRLDSANL